MDGSGRDRQAWKRIVALLFALAAVAEAAGARPRPIRLAVLWLLRSAEAIAWDFAIAVGRESGVDPGLAAPLSGHDLADDAGRLAQSFTALAELLAGLAPRGPSPLPEGLIGDLVGRLARALPSLVHAGRMQEPPSPDTS